MLEPLERRDLLTAVFINGGEIKLGVLNGQLANRQGTGPLYWIDAGGEPIPLDGDGNDIPGDGHDPVPVSGVTSITVTGGGLIDLRGVTRFQFSAIQNVLIEGTGISGSNIFGSEYADTVRVRRNTQNTFHWSSGGGADSFTEFDDDSGTSITVTADDDAFSMSGETSEVLSHRFSAHQTGDISFANHQDTNRVLYSGIASVDDQVIAGFRAITLSAGNDTATLDLVGQVGQVESLVALTFRAPAEELVFRGGAGDDILDVNLAEPSAVSTIVVRGDEGHDLLDASSSTADLTLLGDDGNDDLFGGHGDDHLDGGFGVDVLRFFGEWGVDQVFGDNDDAIDMTNVSLDLIFSVGTIDSPAIVVEDGQGNRVNNDGGDLGELIGGSGNDEFMVLENRELAFGAGRIDGGAGTNALSFEGWQQSVFVDLMTPFGEGLAAAGHAARPTSMGTQRLFGVERIANVTGGRGDDVLAGNSAANLLNGMMGDDLYIVREGWGVDEIEESEGDDELEFETSSGVTFVFGPETDDGPPSLIATASSDRLSAFSSDFSALFAGTGDDVFRVLDGGQFSGDVFGGDGNNTLDFSQKTSPVVADLDVGVVDFDGQPLVVGTATGVARIAEVQRVIGGSAGDDLTGDAGNNELLGGPGDDRLDGDDGDDTLNGGPGFDVCLGGEILIDCDSFDLVAVEVVPVFAGGGIDYTIAVQGPPVATAFVVDFLWSTTASPDGQIGIAASRIVPAGSNGMLFMHLPADALSPLPHAATHLVMQVDSGGAIDEDEEGNNVQRFAIEVTRPTASFVFEPSDLEMKKPYKVFLELESTYALNATYTLESWSESPVAAHPEFQSAMRSGERDFDIFLPARDSVSLLLETDGDISASNSRHVWDWIGPTNPINAFGFLTTILEGTDEAASFQALGLLAARPILADLYGLAWSEFFAVIKTAELLDAPTRSADIKYQAQIRYAADADAVIRPMETVTLNVAERQQHAYDRFAFALPQSQVALAGVLGSLIAGGPLLAGAFAIFGAGTLYSAFSNYNAALDPPDPNFTEFATATPLDLTEIPLEGQFLSSLGEHLAVYPALQEAETLSRDRSDGAAVAEDAFWQSEQLLQSAFFAAEATKVETALVAQLALLDRHTEHTIELLGADPLDENDPLPASLSVLEQLGWTEDQLELLRQEFVAYSGMAFEHDSLAHQLRLQSAVTGLQSLTDLESAMAIRVDTLGLAVRQITTQERNDLVARQDDLLAALETGIPSGQLQDEIAAYLDDVRALIIDSNNLPALQGDLEYGFLAQLAFQQLDFTPAGIGAKVEQLVADGDLEASIADQLDALAVRGQQAIESSDFAMAAWNVASMLDVVGASTAAGRGAVEDYVEYVSGLLGAPEAVVAAGTGGQSPDLLIRRDGANIEIVDQQSSQTIHASAIDATPFVALHDPNGVDNHFVADYAHGGLFALADGLVVDAGGGSGDSLLLNAEPADEVTHSIGRNGGGSVWITSSTTQAALSHDGLETIDDQIHASRRIFALTGTGARGELGDNSAPGDDRYRLRQLDSGQVIDFVHVSGAIEMVGTTDDDVLTALDEFPFPVTLHGGAGTDVLVGSAHDDLLTLVDFSSDVLDGGAGYDAVRLRGSGQQIDLTSSAIQIHEIEVIDIAGKGSNTLVLDAAAVQAISSTTETLRIQHNDDDTVQYGDGWVVEFPAIIDGQFFHRLNQSPVAVEVTNSVAFQNPLRALDVNHDGIIAPIDVLLVINPLNSGGSRELVTPSTLAGVVSFHYVDTNGDRILAPVDVIRIVNYLNELPGQAEGESSPASTQDPVDGRFLILPALPSTSERRAVLQEKSSEVRPPESQRQLPLRIPQALGTAARRPSDIGVVANDDDRREDLDAFFARLDGDDFSHDMEDDLQGMFESILPYRR